MTGLLGLRRLLEADGPGWPAALEHHPQIASTNDRLKELARAGAPEWSVVTADRQTAGRGRHGKVWVSPRGNLHLSVLLRPAAAPGLVPLLAGVAVREAVLSFGAEARLKWPNDVLVEDRKLAGLLAEASSGAQGVEWVVLGIGVNVDPDPVPPKGAWSTEAISLRGAVGRAVALEALASAILRQLSLWYHRAAAGRAADVLLAWREAAVPWWGHPVQARSGDQVIRGIAKGIDEEGALLLLDDRGDVVRVVAGEVSRVRLAAEHEGSE